MYGRAGNRYRVGMSSRGRRRPRRHLWWWFLVALLSAGNLTFPIILYAGLRLRSKLTVALSGVYFAVWVGVIILSETSALALTAGVAMGVSWLGGTAHTLYLSSRFEKWLRVEDAKRGIGVSPPPAVDCEAALPPTDPALDAAHARMARRREARGIVEDNIALAAELRIGRPDLDRAYDDGGIVDVNHVPASVLLEHLDMEPEVADEVIRTRAARNGFDSADDMLIACESLNPERFEMIRERLIFIPRDITRTPSA